MSRVPKGSNSTCLWQFWKPLFPQSPGEMLGGASARRDVSPAARGWQVPAVSSSGSLQIGLASGSCAPQHRTTQPGGGCAEAAWEGTVRMCVSCAGLGSPPALGVLGRGYSCLGAKQGYTEGWSLTVPRPAVLGPGDEIMTLSQVFSSGTLLWAQPLWWGHRHLLSF